MFSCAYYQEISIPYFLLELKTNYLFNGTVSKAPLPPSF